GGHLHFNTIKITAAFLWLCRRDEFPGCVVWIFQDDGSVLRGAVLDKVSLRVLSLAGYLKRALHHFECCDLSRRRPGFGMNFATKGDGKTEQAFFTGLQVKDRASPAYLPSS